MSNPAPVPIRGGSITTRFGFENNDNRNQQKVETQAVMIFRTMVLHHLADKARSDGAMLVLENSHELSIDQSPELAQGDSASLLSWPEFKALYDPLSMGSSGDDESSSRWHLASFDQGPLGHEQRKPTGVLTNSWMLYTILHGRKGNGTLGSPRVESCFDRGNSQWAPGFKLAVGQAVKQWSQETALQRAEHEGDERVVLRALTREEREFREHCEKDHTIFRKDCRVCLEAAMRGHKHLRQRHGHSNALCLSMDLIGPWKEGVDHALSGSARHILVATLGVPVYKDGSIVLWEQKEEDKSQKERGGEREQETEDTGAGVGDIVLDDPAYDEERGEEEEDRELSAEEYKKLCEAQDEGWRKIAADLKAPVEIHEILFAEPLMSKRASEVLRAVQRIYARIRLLNLEVRRTHTDGGREFTNKQYRSWCASRDIHPTYSAPGDPKGNGRVESAVGRVKAGIRGLLRSTTSLGHEHWPSVLRQVVAQRFEHSMTLLGGPRATRRLVPFGTEVVVHSRAWTHKTLYAPRAIRGTALCPAANAHGCTVVLIASGDAKPRFHIAPVVYENVKEPVSFNAHDEPPVPPSRRLASKGPVVAHACVGGESESEGGFNGGRDRKEVALLEALPNSVEFQDRGIAVPVIAPPSGGTDAHDARLRSAKEPNDADDAPFSISEGPVQEMPWKREERRDEGTVQVCNLWMEPVECRVCEGPVCDVKSFQCKSCGLQAAKKLSVMQSEEAAKQLLESTEPLQRDEVDHLIANSLCSWNPKTRKLDQELKGSAALGWTLGFYQHGPKIGVTSETHRRPYLTKVINRYMRQAGGAGTWASIRVSSDFKSGIHRDRNEPGSLNLVVPVSRFGRGRIWVEGEPKGFLEKGVEGSSEQGSGRYVGGDEQVVWFDASRKHSVEASDGTRRVFVGYTPKGLSNLPPNLCDFLQDLSFPLPSVHQEPSTLGRGTSSDGSGSAVAVKAASTARDDTNGCWVESSLFDTEMQQLQQEHLLLRRFLLEQHKHLQEEVSIASGEAWEAQTGHLNDLYQWIDSLEKCVVQQDAAQRLQDPLTSGDEKLVLQARLRSLGVEAQNPPSPDQQWNGLYEDQDSTDVESGGVGGNNFDPGPDLEAQTWQAQPAQVLQTVAVPHAEIIQNIEQWRPTINDELGNIFDVHRTLRKIDDQDVAKYKEAGDTIEYLPAKALFHLKAGAGREKCRVVACGNFAEDAGNKSKEKRFQNYAGGADTLSLRCHMKLAGSRASTHRWLTSGGDIRTAFLLAPLQKPGHRKILRPPNVLIRAGVVSASELWLVEGAIYGLQESPAAWAEHRDSVLPTIEIKVKDQSLYLQKSSADANMWMLRCPRSNELLALLTVYVDDLLLSADTEVSSAVWKAIQDTWKISTPVYATEKEGLKFCGFELRQNSEGLWISQKSYIQFKLSWRNIRRLKERSQPLTARNQKR